jgi:serine/threonine protein kinase
MNYDLKSFIESFPENLPIPMNLIKTALRQILKALEYLNMEKILHRDLKPQNILVNFNKETQELSAKLADFGLARTYSILNKIFTKNTSNLKVKI